MPIFKEIVLSDYERWVACNGSGKFSMYDYLHGVFSTKDVSSDLVVAFLKLFFPDFYVYENGVFLKEEFDKNEYNNLVARGYFGKDLEYWMNLLNIDSLFGVSSFEFSKYIANNIALLWHRKLSIDFPEMRFETKCICESDDEVYVVFYQCQDSYDYPTS